MPAKEEQHWMYSDMVASRKFEEATGRIYLEGNTPAFDMADGTIPGEMRLGNGQEPVAVGVCTRLKHEDVVTATHRPHQMNPSKVLPCI